LVCKLNPNNISPPPSLLFAHQPKTKANQSCSSIKNKNKQLNRKQINLLDALFFEDLMPHLLFQIA
jgi:hypothetical protein